MNTAVSVALLFCLVAVYASALPAEPVSNNIVKEVAPVAGIEGQEVLQGEESRWGHGGHHGGGHYGGGHHGGGHYGGGHYGGGHYGGGHHGGHHHGGGKGGWGR